MTLEEFNSQGWTGGMKAKVNGTEYDVINCDFELRTVGLNVNGELQEVSYEHCTIVKESK